MSKLDRFTENARKALKQAQNEAQHANHNYIGTEHLLLGLLSVRGCTAHLALFDIGIKANSIRSNFFQQVGTGERKPFGTPVLAPRVKQVLTLGIDSATKLGAKHIGTGHLMLGILKEGNGIGIELLKQSMRDSYEMRNLQPQPSVDFSEEFSLLEERLLTRIQGGISSSSLHEERLLQPTGNDPLVVRSEQKQLFEFLTSAGASKFRLKWAKESAAQEERNRIARDLHDSIKQQLFNIKVSAAAVHERWEKDADGAKAALVDVQESAQAAMIEMNALLMQLSPEPLEKTGLIEALREQCQALAFRTGTQVNTALGDLPPEEVLPSGTQIALFRIAQEALANIARHARADNVLLRVDTLWDEQAVLLEISDDGQGYEPAKIPKGMGLTNMKERTELLKGSVEIVSQPDEGTTVTVKVPLCRC